jgi:hypothetical protein
MPYGITFPVAFRGWPLEYVGNYVGVR